MLDFEFYFIFQFFIKSEMIIILTPYKLILSFLL